MAYAKLEARFTVPSGGWDITLTESGGSTGTVTVDAGDYYLSTGANTFLAELKTELEVVGDATYTVSLNSSSGIITITASGGGVTGFTFTEIDSELTERMGFTQASYVSALTQTGDSSATSIWLPNTPYLALNNADSWRGYHETDLQQLESPSGYVYSISGERKIVKDLVFEAVNDTRTWVKSETVRNQSFERFYIDHIVGEGDGATPGGPVRFHKDADDDAEYGTYYVVGMKDWRPEFVKEGWAGRYTITMPRLVLHPDEKSAATLGDA